MTRAHKISNLFGAVIPFLAFIAAVVLLWNRIVDWSDLGLFAALGSMAVQRPVIVRPSATPATSSRTAGCAASAAGSSASPWSAC